MGLRFAARIIATREQPDEAVEEVTGDEGNIAEYLLGEVLSAQPPEIRQLLLSTSVPDTLQPGLTEEMGGRSAGRTLALLTKGNAFIEPVPEHAGFYRYHPFFRDMLRAELAFESPDLMDELQRRAAEWYAREGFVVEAVSHFASIDAWTDAAAELVDELAVGELLLGTTSSPLAKVVGGLPGDLVTPAACVVRAVLARLEGEAELFSEQLDLAELTAQPEGGHPARAVSLTIDVLKVVRARGAGDARATLQLAERAERSLNARENRVQVEQHPELAALVLAARGDADAREGRLARGLRRVRRRRGRRLRPRGGVAAARVPRTDGGPGLLRRPGLPSGVHGEPVRRAGRQPRSRGRGTALRRGLGTRLGECRTRRAPGRVRAHRGRAGLGPPRPRRRHLAHGRQRTSAGRSRRRRRRPRRRGRHVRASRAAPLDEGQTQPREGTPSRGRWRPGGRTARGGGRAGRAGALRRWRWCGPRPPWSGATTTPWRTCSPRLLDQDAPLATQVAGWLLEAARQLHGGFVAAGQVRARPGAAARLRATASGAPFRQAPRRRPEAARRRPAAPGGEPVARR